MVSNDIELLLATFAPYRFETLPFGVMRILSYVSLVLLIEITNYAAARKKHLHLRIYVPDIVKHHLHTKTVYVRMPKAVVKVPKTRHKQVYHANWSSWSSYGQHNDHKNYHGTHELADEQENPRHDRQKTQKYFPLHGYHRDSYFPRPHVDDNNLEENSEEQDDPYPRYAVRENVNDVPPNGIETFSYEEGYRKGLQSESGHLRSGQSSQFHDDQHEEQDDAENDGLKEDSKGKTDAGRYLVDDVEYENTRDKRAGSHDRRRNQKI